MKVVDRAKELVARQRRERPWLDHAVRTVQRYNDGQGNQLAGAVTYFAFLSLFPLIAIGFAVVSWVVRFYPEARVQLETFLQDNLPGLTGPDGIDVDAIAEAGGARIGAAGILGALGLLYSGLGFVDALRQALRRMWGIAPEDHNLVVRKLVDVVVLITLGGTILLTTAFSGITTAATEWVLDLLGLDSGGLVEFGLQALAIALAVLANTVLLLVVFARLPGHTLPWRNVWTGALLGAVGIEVLKQLAALVLGSTSGNPVYGTFAGLVTVLVWINFIGRVVMYAAAWAVTGPIPTVEADVAAQGEVLDAPAADAAERAREQHPDDEPVPLPEEHRTTAGAVPLTTTGIAGGAGARDGAEDGAEDRVGRATEETDGAVRRGRRSTDDGDARPGPLGWVLALVAVAARRRGPHERGRERDSSTV